MPAIVILTMRPVPLIEAKPLMPFHLEDSSAFRAFARLEMGQYALESGIESGRKVRIDSTVVESNIHDPSDSTLLWDGIRVITRWLEEGHALAPRPGYRYCDHCRVVKKRLMVILNAKKEEESLSLYLLAAKTSGVKL